MVKLLARILGVLLPSLLLGACAALPVASPAATQPGTSPALTVSSIPTEIPPTPTLDRAAIRFDGQRALQHAAEQMEMGPRPAGSPASAEAAEYILTYLDGQGWETETQRFVYQGVQAQNLIARRGEPGGPVYMFGAHYDTRRAADQDPEAPEAPVPGANDGASGVAVLLELARVADLSKLEGEVWLLFFDAEDNGGLDGWEFIAGSRHFVSAMTDQPEYFVLVDMVGDADQQLYLELNSDPVLRQHLWDVAAELGYSEWFIPEPGYSMLDDHTPFLERGIPAVDIIDFDYPYWHTTEDTLDKLSAPSLERVGRVLEVFIESGGQYPGGVE